MAYRIVATLLAEGVSLDRYTNRFTAFNMLESVMAPSFPAVLGKIAVVTYYEVDGERAPRYEQVSVRDPDGNSVAEITHELRGDAGTHRATNMFQGVRLQRPGTYRVVVLNAPAEAGPWTEIASRRLIALEQPHPLSTGPAEISGPASLVD